MSTFFFSRSIPFHSSPTVHKYFITEGYDRFWSGSPGMSTKYNDDCDNINCSSKGTQVHAKCMYCTGLRERFFLPLQSVTLALNACLRQGCSCVLTAALAQATLGCQHAEIDCNPLGTRFLVSFLQQILKCWHYLGRRGHINQLDAWPVRNYSSRGELCEMRIDWRPIAL